MAAKAKATKTAAPAAETNGHSSTSVGELIPIGQLRPSPTNPRKRFPEASIEELAASIREQGVIEPLIVRPHPGVKMPGFEGPIKVKDTFEIVCGERRYRASQRTDLERLPCIVRDLTDDQVLDIQIHENLHREDVHPMDEAVGYKVIRDTLKCSIPELAIRLGKDTRFVHARLKLNDLLPEFKKAIEDNFLSISAAYLICRYPEDKQKVILKKATEYSKGKLTENSTPDRGDVERITRQYIECKLSDAPFSLTDHRLRKDGLKCGDCQSRAGANPTLFEPVKPKEDRCLDSTCFGNKMTAFVSIGRDDLSLAGEKKFGASYEAAIVGYDHYNNRKSHKDQIGKNDYKKFGDYGRDDKAKCTGKEQAIYLDYNGTPSTISICRDKSCPMHWKIKKSSTSSSDGLVGSVDREERKEEIFDAKVREAVRTRVLLEAAPHFAGSFGVESNDPEFFLDLIERTWDRLGDTDHIEHRLVRPYLQSASKKVASAWSRAARRKVLGDTLDLREMAATLFLLVKGPQGAMLGGDRYTSQAEIMAIAARYGINYRLYDAEERLNFCKNKKQRVGLEDYHAKVIAGEAAEIPRFWKPDYVSDDSIAVADADDIDTDLADDFVDDEE